ncbi:MAG: Ig-like domain repeat protein, partial [Planctomycetota bacterium]|nr:Ig-like domain repeat protein [Planctomycetota bacterium]
MESLRLESLEQRVLLSAFVVNDTSDSGPGSLRQAILDANATPGADVITFALGGGVVEIQPLTALPSITDPVTLDGTTQGGYAGSPLIWLDGSACANAANGLTLDAGDSLIRGLAITGFNLSGVAIHGQNDRVQDSFIGVDPTGAVAVPNGANGIEVADASGALIQGNVISGNSSDGVLFTGAFSDGQVVDNFIGLDASGTHALANWGSGVHVGATQAGLPSATVRGNVISSNFGDGVWLDGAAEAVVAGNVIGADASGTLNVDDLGGLLSNFGNGVTVSGDGNTIGGPDAADRNIISGNFGDGVQIQAGSGNTVQGNYIGTTADGTAPLPNYGNGVAVLASGNRIAANVLSGNYGDGARVLADANVLQGNFIGTAADGLGALGNNADGLWIEGSGNLVGGAQAGQGNVIAFNTGNGVTVADGTGNAVRGNSIFANATGDPARPGIGIDLGNDGVTANDSQGHVGPNQFQNFPVLMDASRTGNTFTIDGALTGAPSTAYTVEFFSSVAADPSGYGQGQTYLGSLDVVTDAAGAATFQATLTAAVGAQNVVTATATDSAGNTSEFGLGQNVVVIVETTQDATATVVSSNVNPSVIGQPVTLTATVSDLVASYTPTGWVTFMDGAITLGSAGLSGGTASLTTWSLPVGAHTIVAIYNGDSTCEPSASGPFAQVVAQGTTVTTVASSTNPSTIGQAVTLSANVAFLDPADAVLTGSVTFMDGSAVLGTVDLTNGAASLTTAALTVGTHSITAVYNGDTNFAVSTSAPQSQVVSQGHTVTTLTSSTNPSTIGQSVTLSATVNFLAPANGVLTGSVTFMDGSAVLGTVDLTNGAASLTTAALTVGAHTITAVYSGDTNFAVSTSAPQSQVVNQG